MPTLVEWSLPERTPFEAGSSLGLLETDKATVELPAERAGVLLLTLVSAGSSIGVDEPIAILGELADLDRTPESLLAEAGLSAPAAATSRMFASPLARRVARNAQLDLAEIAGTGPGGRIVRRDVEAALRQQQPGDVKPAASVVPEPVATDSRRVPHTKLRKAMASRLSESKRTVPHFYLRGRARAEALLHAREQLNAARAPDTKITINDLIVKAVGRAHALVPALNRIWTEEAVLAFDRVDVAVAVATEAGVVTPVVRAVDRTSIDEIASHTRRLTSEARESRLKQSDIEGGTITVSNLGMFAVDEFSAIVNPPQSAILAVGGVRDEAVVDDSKVVPGKVMRFVLSVDHRPVDGADAALWMQEFVALVECPIRILT